VTHEKHAVVVDDHTSMNALDWSGTYTGTLPCADCAGIETSLTLSPARTYVLRSRYLDRQAVEDEFVHSGVFAWSRDGRSIELMGIEGGRSRFQVGENRLFALDQTGARIAGALAAAYTLTRSGAIAAADQAEVVNLLSGPTWTLVELHGAALAPQVAAPWVEFVTEGQRVSGFSGCNRFFGVYHTGADTPQASAAAMALTFDSMGATRMACSPAAMRLESQFLALLAQVAGWYLEPGNNVKEQNSSDGSVLVFVDSTQRVIARCVADLNGANR